MTTTVSTRTNAQWFALVFGAVYLIVGIAGFFVTGFDGFTAETYDEKLIIFPVNPLHNVVHVVLGLGWLGAASSPSAARAVNTLYGIILILVGVLGMLKVLQFLAIEDAASADNYLHLGSGILSLAFGTVASGDRVRTT